MTATPVLRCTEVAIAGFQAVHSFGPLSVTFEQIVKPRFWRSRTVSAKASAIVALFWPVSSTRRQKYKFSTIKLTKGMDDAATVSD
jgi:hypothetical protein